MVDLLAIAQLANNGEEISRVQALEFFIESARGAKVSKFERAAGVFDAVAQNVQRAAFFNLGRKSLEKPFFDLASVVLLESVPHLRLRCIDEIEDHARIKAKRFVVVFRPSSSISAGRIFVSFQRFDNDAFPS